MVCFHFLTIVSNAAGNIFRGYMSSISFFMKTTISGKERSVRYFMPVNRKGFTGRSVREQGKWEQPELGPRGDATGGPPRRPCPAGTARPALGCLWASSTCRWDHCPPTSTTRSQGSQSWPIATAPILKTHHHFLDCEVESNVGPKPWWHCSTTDADGEGPKWPKKVFSLMTEAINRQIRFSLTVPFHCDAPSHPNEKSSFK